MWVVILVNELIWKYEFSISWVMVVGKGDFVFCVFNLMEEGWLFNECMEFWIEFGQCCLLCDLKCVLDQV